VVEAILINSSSSIASERKGHRRGLVLGFTMAEIFLLLVFCLLLVAAAVISAERQLRNQAGSDRDSAVAELNIANQKARDLADQNKLLSEKMKGLSEWSRTRLRSARIGAN
jgi:cell division protein FtsL